MPYINPILQLEKEIVVFSKSIIFCISQKRMSEDNCYNSYTLKSI